jgi:hypothetical protein
MIIFLLCEPVLFYPYVHVLLRYRLDDGAIMPCIHSSLPSAPTLERQAPDRQNGSRKA